MKKLAILMWLLLPGLCLGWGELTLNLNGIPLSATAPLNGQVYVYNSTLGMWVPGTVAGGDPAVGGDLSGTASSASVVKIQGRSVDSTAPTLNYVLKWDGSKWAPAADSTGAGGVVSGAQDGSSLGEFTTLNFTDQLHCYLAGSTLNVSLTPATAALLPTIDQKAALAGTGTPGVGNVYVTADHAALTNARTPTAHAPAHRPTAAGGTDPLDDSYTTTATFNAHSHATAAHAYIHRPTAAGGTDPLDATYTTTATFNAHASRHNAGGADALAIDAAQATGSLRTISTASPEPPAATAAAGNGTAASASNHVHAGPAVTVNGTAHGATSTLRFNGPVNSATAAGTTDITPRAVNALGYAESLSAEVISATTVSVTLTNIVVTNSAGEGVLASFTGTGDISADLDTGSEASSTWYRVWLETDSAGANGLLKFHATNASRPAPMSGRSHAAPIMWVRNDGSSNLVRAFKSSLMVRIETAAGSLIVNGGTSATPTLADASNYVPPGTRTMLVTVLSTVANPATSGGTDFPGFSYASLQNQWLINYISINASPSAGYSLWGPVTSIPLTESRTFAWQSRASTTTSIYCAGWYE